MNLNEPGKTRIDRVSVIIRLDKALLLAVLFIAIGLAGGWTVRRWQTRDVYYRSAAEAYFAVRDYYHQQTAAILAEAEQTTKEKKNGHTGRH